MANVRIAVIGFGERMSTMIRQMREVDAEFTVSAIADPGKELALKRARELGWEKVAWFNCAEELLKHAGDFDGLVISTPCHLHTPIAVMVGKTKLPIFLEKPVAINWRQLRELSSAFAGREDEVVVSFPLRLTQHVRRAIEIIRSGRLGTINQIQAINNVPYGGVYFGDWYRNYDVTGGLWLQKATHDFDYINQLMMAQPTYVMAMSSRKIYGGKMPEDLHCSACTSRETCEESPKNLVKRGDDGGMLGEQALAESSDHLCAFSESIKNQDAGSAMIMYENGAHASYVQNFIPRLNSRGRGASVFGYDATLTFDWTTDVLRVMEHHRAKVEEIKIDGEGTHSGGDRLLAESFIDIIRRRGKSKSSLKDGILSAAMCLAAKESAYFRQARGIPPFEIPQPDDAIEPV